MTCSIVSLLFFLFGYLIWKKKMLFLIAGYDEETFVGDKEKLAKMTGIFSIFIGVITFVLPFGLETIGSISGIVYTVIILISTIIFVIKINMKN
ncbi:hypothetical protein DCC39_16080 [Pueribacillus theae]|uniref:DUF3784 domain-containing protein n=1 Tax=Pueribacillus theae TaxID=2171751 RepID=A0A2U1JS93_9BACI|nr:DUF3784 domain-containing protein [Pueribacillus theae]PWA07814.1 hypothetical protein DCC39_16080 [Pueribacillus theae]